MAAYFVKSCDTHRWTLWAKCRIFCVKSNGRNPNHSISKSQNLVGQAWRYRIPSILHVDLHVKAFGSTKNSWNTRRQTRPLHKIFNREWNYYFGQKWVEWCATWKERLDHFLAPSQEHVFSTLCHVRTCDPAFRMQ